MKIKSLTNTKNNKSLWGGTLIMRADQSRFQYKKTLPVKMCEQNKQSCTATI